MKKRSGTQRRDRGRRRQAVQRQGAAPQAAAPTGTPTKPMVTVPPVGGVSHRQVLSDIRKIGIIGAAALLVLLVLFIVWR
jgi:hypothetical protein